MADGAGETRVSGITLDFIGSFLRGFTVNLEIAVAALLFGGAAAAPLALLRHYGGWAGRCARAFTGFLRATPTFVAMFFLLYMVPGETSLFGWHLQIAGEAIVVFALALYVTAAVSDDLLDALRTLAAGERGAVLLLAPNLLRIFIVLVLASSVGAAIGVQEAITRTLQQADRLPTPGSRIALVLVVILFFAATMQLARGAIAMLTRSLQRRSVEANQSSDGDAAAAGGERLLTWDLVLLTTTNYRWSVIFIGALLGFAWVAVPKPPAVITIEAGPPDGSWYQSAAAYRDYLQARGVQVRLRSSDSSLRIVQDVNRPESGIDAGFVLHDVDPDEVPNVSSLGSIDYEPLFVVYRRALGQLESLAQLRRLCVGLPPRASVTAYTAMPILAAFGVTEETARVSFEPVAALAGELTASSLDAILLMLTVDNPLISRLIERDDLAVVEFRQAAAITQRFANLTSVVVPEATYDLVRSIPAHPLSLVAGISQVVVRQDLHPAVVYLLLQAMAETHHAPSPVSRAGEFPALPISRLPVASYVRDYYRSGLPWIYRALPIWLANVFSYYATLIVPLLLVAPMCQWLGFVRLNEMLAVARAAIWLRMLRDMEERLVRGVPVSPARLNLLRTIRASLDKQDGSARLRLALERIDRRLPGG